MQADKDQNQTELQITAPAVEIQGNSLPETPHPLIDLSSEKLADYDFLLRNFYIVDENTDDKAVTLDISGLQRGGKGRYHCWRRGLSGKNSHREIWLSGPSHNRSL